MTDRPPTSYLQFIGLTIPAVASLTLAGRTRLPQGVVHLVILGAFILFALVP